MSDVLIVGGGVMGLMTARELARSGCRVTLLERGEPGREASWAGGGIVSPLYPWRYSPAVTALARHAKREYPALVEALLNETGIDAELVRCGMLMLDAHDTRDALAWAEREDEVVQRHDHDAMRYKWPWLSPVWHEGLLMPGIAHVRNPRLLHALKASLPLLGVRVESGAEVVGMQLQDTRVVSVMTDDGRQFSGDQVVICGGAWSSGLLHRLGVQMTVPVRPVRGQMLLYRLAPGTLPCMVMANGRYLIPRRDGHVLCGSTLEETGFDNSTTEEARVSLMQSATQLLPQLEGVEPVAHWAGLRPGSPNGIPFIGRIPERDNLWINAGHFRNGLVLAPASARLLADLLLQREPMLDPSPYQCL